MEVDLALTTPFWKNLIFPYFGLVSRYEGYPTIILCSWTAIYTILLQNLSGDPIEMVLEFFQVFSSAPLTPRQYLENFGATFGAFWTGRALVYNFRKTVTIFALNRYCFVIIQLITGKSTGEGITRFRIVSDSVCKPTPEPEHLICWEISP